jgi:hypothetical protein
VVGYLVSNSSNLSVTRVCSAEDLAAIFSVSWRRGSAVTLHFRLSLVGAYLTCIDRMTAHSGRIDINPQAEVSFLTRDMTELMQG